MTPTKGTGTKKAMDTTKIDLPKGTGIGIDAQRDRHPGYWILNVQEAMRRLQRVLKNKLVSTANPVNGML